MKKASPAKKASSLPQSGTLSEPESADALTVVGIGASAGGIKALQEFFGGVRPGVGMAFVVVLHLSSEHESFLAELLQSVTELPVRQVAGAVRVEADHVYIIPPARSLVMDDRMLHLSPLENPYGRRVTIDRFLRTLAESCGPQAVGVVLSGTGADGTLGLKMVKELGGLCIAQDPGDAEFSEMPESAIATGMMDFVLAARSMPAQIQAYRDASRRMRVPAEAAPSPGQSDDSPEAEKALQGILAQTRIQTGHDFSFYKRATVLRRIGRRLQVNGCGDLVSYLDFLRRHPAEAAELLSDLLISVTQFFRDTDAWAALEQGVIPRLFESKGADGEVRAWVCGCATGEEAYSLAILLAEQAERLEHPPRIQVFATDINNVIAQARGGSYPETIAEDISPERLRRWFTLERGRYSVKKELRDLVLFTTHNILRETPFSRQDLITCRNLLIYLNRDAQDYVFELFHFALQPEGRLFLGPSESADGTATLFHPTDEQYRHYIRRPIFRPPLRLSASAEKVTGAQAAPLPAPARGATAARAAAPLLPPLQGLGEVHHALLEMYAPPSVLINEHYDIVHLSDRAGQMLRFGGGEPTRDLLRLVPPPLRLELRSALYAAAGGGEEVRLVSATIGDEASRPVRLTVRPIREPEAMRGYFLVLMEQLEHIEQLGSGDEALPRSDLSPPRAGASEAAAVLEAEIARLRERLSSTVQQYEDALDEMKASNEELQAVNEEFRSATEELETSREELQSVNEEVATVNQELRHRMEEISRSKSDLENLLSATDIATIFLDRDLKIRMYTPAAESIFNIISTDVGRPLSHLTHSLGYDSLPDARSVLETLAPLEREVLSQESRYFLTRILPYTRSNDNNQVDGVVLTFVDITGRKQAELELESRTREVEALNVRLRRAITETHHRVKNNLQVIAAMIEMHKMDHAAERAIPIEAFEQLNLHVQSLAVVHDMLTNSDKDGDDAQMVPIKIVLEKLLPMLQQTATRGAIAHHIEDITLTAKQCIALSLLISELVSNALKHGQHGVEVSLRVASQTVEVLVEDNGPGFPDGFDPLAAGSTGLSIIESLVGMDLAGRSFYGNRPQGGGRVRITFPVSEAVSS